MHYYLEGGNGGFAIQTPLVLGHESCGIVTALGADLPVACDLKVGDRVAMEVGICCKSCRNCKIGRYNLCKQMKFRSSAKTVPHEDGTLREVMVHQADLVYKLAAFLLNGHLRFS